MAMDIRLDNIYNIDCIEGMKCIDADSIDCVVTSPPYDNMRTYDGVADGWNFEKFQQIAQQLFRVMKDGGMVAWVVADATIDGSETGSSFRQALYFKDVGFNLVDTMIYKKHGTPPIGSTKWYFNCFEYIFILSKGKMRECNLIRDVPVIRLFQRKDDPTFWIKAEPFDIGIKYVHELQHIVPFYLENYEFKFED